MLYFYNKENGFKLPIGFDFEMGEKSPYFATSVIYCNESSIERLFPNIVYFSKDKLPLDSEEFLTSLGSGKYFTNKRDESEAEFLMSPGQFRGFIKEWINNSFTTNKLYKWDEHSFYVEYVQTIREIATIDNECQCEGQWNGDDDLMNWDKINRVLDINYSENDESPIKISSVVNPEYSIKVEDALYAFKNGITSIYTDEINEEINHNIRKMMLTQKVFSNFGADVAKFDIPLDLDITIKDIDYTNDKSILYFYYYSILPGIRTNLKHLRKVLDCMK